LIDPPWEGIAAKLVLSVRKFFCLNPERRQKIFCELLSWSTAPTEGFCRKFKARSKSSSGGADP
jgi:hypothetical protein